VAWEWLSVRAIHWSLKLRLLPVEYTPSELLTEQPLPLQLLALCRNDLPPLLLLAQLLWCVRCKLRTKLTLTKIDGQARQHVSDTNRLHQAG
jgi:hypothetical protein